MWSDCPSSLLIEKRPYKNLLNYTSRSESNRTVGYPPLEVTAILSSEIEPPEGVDKIEWLLLSSIVLTDTDRAFELINWYLCRWEVEIFFKVLKSGCKIEELQLETEERTIPCLMLYMIVAWRIMYLTKLGRTHPDVSCEILFHKSEWQSIYANKNKSVPPETPPSLKQMVTWVAELGGFLNRKSDGSPGPKVMWLGMQKMRVLAESWEVFNKIYAY